MKKIIILLLLRLPLLVCSQQSEDTLFVNESKINISGGMGIAAIYINNLADYLNSYSSTLDYSTISTIPVFFINCEYRFSDNYGIKIDYNYMLKTYNVESNLSMARNIDASYYIHSPALLLNYIIRDKGYLFKFGAGLSYNYVELETNASTTGIKTTYKSTGLGLRLDAHGHTQFSKNLYLIFALGISSGFLSDLESDSDHVLTYDKNINISFVSASLSLGLAYYF